MPTISSLLVANRGEIARRIFRTASRMGIRTVAVYSEPDRLSPHVGEADLSVAIGGSAAAESYLRGDAIIEAARRAGADAIHPGYGFLSENASFAEAVVDAGLVFIGPTPDNIRAMGGKIEAKRIAVAAGMPTLPSAVIEGDDPTAWLSAAVAVGYPVLIKATAGGGGRGMRIVESGSSLTDDVRGARREAASSFGDGTVFIERYLPTARHIEIQVFGDTHGNVVHLHERECSIQRRHQKIIEEAPSPAVSPELRARIGATAVSLARSIGYVGAGTVELLLDGSRGGEEFFFLEMNTRLQVEHPVTECITGTDLVRWQIQVANGEPLPLTQTQIELRGHAIEVRLYAEDPANDFLPTFGTLHHYDRGPVVGVRHDDGVASGSVVSTFYDPMLSKVIAHAPTRVEAIGLLRSGLSQMAIHGVVTNRDYLTGVLGENDFVAGRTDTSYVEMHPDLLVTTHPVGTTRAHIIAATIVGSLQRRTCDRRWSFAPAGWRNLRSQAHRISYEAGAQLVDVSYEWTSERALTVTVDGQPHAVGIVMHDRIDASADLVALDIDRLTERFVVRIRESQSWINSTGGQTALVEVARFPLSAVGAAAAGPTAPVPGRVVQVSVAAGDRVEAGQVLAVMEAMKMEHRIEAASAATVVEVLCAVGDQVDAHQLLVVLEAR